MNYVEVYQCAWSPFVRNGVRRERLQSVSAEVLLQRLSAPPIGNISADPKNLSVLVWRPLLQTYFWQEFHFHSPLGRAVFMTMLAAQIQASKP